MNGPVIKICGVRSPDIARQVESLGADLMGLILAPSRRRVSLDEADKIVAALEGRTKVVGVFVNETAIAVNEIAERLDLDFVQLSGDEPPEIQREVSRPVIRALRIPSGTSFDDASRLADSFLSCVSPAYAFLLDTHVEGVYGGTGNRGDWALAARLAQRYPIILAGGLSPENVQIAIESVSPFGVDVSSGVETDGRKNPALITEFIATVRAAEACVSAARRDTSTRLVRAIG